MTSDVNILRIFIEETRDIGKSSVSGSVALISLVRLEHALQQAQMQADLWEKYLGIYGKWNSRNTISDFPPYV